MSDEQCTLNGGKGGTYVVCHLENCPMSNPFFFENLGQNSERLDVRDPFLRKSLSYQKVVSILTVF